MKKTPRITVTAPTIVRQRTADETRCTPADLPRQEAVAIAIVDVDNIVIGRDGSVDPEQGLAAVKEVYEQLNTVEMTLAVVSEPAARSLGPDIWFRFPQWTWRVAETGPDAADHQLLDYARTVLRQRPGSRIAVASGDGIFAELALDTTIEVVVPRGHPGVARRLRRYLRVRRPQVRGSHDLAA